MRITVAVLTTVVLVAAVVTLVVRSQPGLLASAGPTAAGASPASGDARAAAHADSDAAPGPRSVRAAISPAPTPERDYSALRRRLADLLAQPRLGLHRADLSVAVRDADGRTVFDRGADEPQLPASTIKLVTAATLLDTFGPDHRLTTTVTSQGQPEGGRLQGDLVIRGGGDPALATPAFARFVARQRPRTPMERLAGQVAAAGVETVRGDLVADPSVLSGPALAEGWKDSYLDSFYARRIRGLTVNAGLAVDFTGRPSEDTAVVRQAADPARQAALELRRLLGERGVSVAGTIRVADTGSPDVAVELASVDSPTIEQLLRHMIRESDNHLADTLIRIAAASAGGDGSWESAEELARSTLESLGVDTDGFRLADGSGLSRADRMTAAQLAELDAAMTASRYGRLWQRLMAVTGESGTLEDRLDDTIADGAFHGKTGTLLDVTAVAGTVHGPDDARYHVAAIANRAAGERWAARQVINEVVLLLAENQRGCVRRPRRGAIPEDARPYRLRCPQP